MTKMQKEKKLKRNYIYIYRKQVHISTHTKQLTNTTKRRPSLCPTSKWEISIRHVKKLAMTTCG